MAEMEEEPPNAVSEAYKYSHLYSFSGSNKAGMDGMDKDKQAQIIHEMSKDSAFFKRAAKLDAEADLKVQGMKKIVAEVKGPLKTKLRNDVLQMSLELERKRNFSRICCVLDMDMFFAAVEIRDQPHLKDLPVAVGGMSMISTANYVARKYGVRAAMPGFIAKKLCPQLVFVGMSFDKYQAVSDQVKDIIGEYDPDYTSHSLDEVYFDLEAAAITAWQKQQVGNNNTGTSHDDNTRSENLPFGDTEDACITKAEPYSANASNNASPTIAETPDVFTLRAIAVELLHEIRRRITQVTNGLTCSAGMANNHYLAKIGADVNKPNGQFELPPTREAVLEFVSKLPTRKVGGIGKVTERMLENLLGIKTMAQVSEQLPQLLHVVSPILFQFLLRTSMGIGSHEGEAHRHDATDTSEKKAYMRKSLGCERTFNSKGIQDPVELHARLRKICQHVADDMASEDLWARAVTLKLKNLQFELITRIATSAQYFQSVEAIESMARSLLDEAMPVNIRLMGVSVSKFRQPEAEVDPKQKNMLMFLKTKPAVVKEMNGEGEEKDQSSSSSSSRGSAGMSRLRDGVSSDVSVSPNRAEKTDVTDSFVSRVDAASPAPRRAATSPGVSPAARDPSASTSSSSSRVFSSAATAQSAVCVSGLGQEHTCPVCGAQVPGMLARFNQHLDRCLGIRSDQGVESAAVSAKQAWNGLKGAKKAHSGAQEKAGGKNNNPLLVALTAAASKSTYSSTTSNAGGSGGGGGSGSGSGSVTGKRSDSGAGITISSAKAAKSQKKDALALEITDYFTFKQP